MNLVVPILSILMTLVSRSADAQAVPRTADGHPNFEGYWVFSTATPVERPEQLAGVLFFANDAEADQFLQEADARRQATVTSRLGVMEVRENLLDRPFTEIAGRKVTALVFEPEDGRIPYKSPRDQQAPLVERFDGPADIPLSERCLRGASGAPLLQGVAPTNVQIFQSPDHLVLLQEYGPELRVVPFNGGAHLSSRFQMWTGDSRGRWEGETFVIDSTRFRDQLWQRPPASRFDHNLHLIERFTLTGPDTIWYEFTIDDPTLFTRPWSVHFALRRADGQTFEFACHEGNYSLPNMLRGARAQDGTERGNK